MFNNEFKAIEKKYNSLWQKGNREEALELVEKAAESFPEEEYTTYLDLAVLNLELDNFAESKKYFNESLDKGYWYPEVFFKPVFEKKEFKDIADRWRKLKEEALNNAEPDYKLIEPENYNPEKVYPLFIAIHGWGESADHFSWYWKSKKISKEYFLLLPQSSQIIGTRNYCWDDKQQALQEIKDTCEEVLNNYNIDPDKIIMGGFSQGGALAINISLEQVLPVRGFVSLCPYITDEPNVALEPSIRGVIITGDQDLQYSEQKELKEQFNEHNIPVEMTVEEGLGHWFPDDLSRYIDNALGFIFVDSKK